jgi:hypothetical protein
MKALLVIGSLFLTLGAQAAQAVRIEVRTNSGTLVLPYDIDKAEVSLDLGEKVETIKVLGMKKEVEVDQLFETSVTLQNEGPRWDLLDWKHGYTEAVPLVKQGSGYKAIRVPVSDKTLAFPEASLGELVAQVEKSGASKNFLDLARACKSLRTESCSIGVSQQIFQIGEKTKLYGIKKQIIFKIPMGC